MGIFGGIKSIGRSISSGICAAGSSIKNGVKKTCTTIKSGVKKAKKKISNVWGNFSGKAQFEEAKRIQGKFTKRFSKAKEDFNTQTELLFNKIEKSIENINNNKSTIHKKLLPEMVEKLSKIKDIKIPKEFEIEEYQRNTIKLDRIKSRDELFKIDFDKHKFKTFVQATFTFGFYTRKKSKETLFAVKEEAKKIDNEIAKMKAEIKKLEGIVQALENTEHYFESVLNIYTRLLTRVDNSINTLYFKSIRFTHSLISSNFSLRMLPKVSQKEIENLITASKVLKNMAETKVSSMDKDTINEYQKEAKKSKDEIGKKLKVA
ncbi:MAG: DNA repair protein [Firmicutes bacterium]|nr:DNA repair protein [Bacillota bacterium]